MKISRGKKFSKKVEEIRATKISHERIQRRVQSICHVLGKFRANKRRKKIISRKGNEEIAAESSAV
jgi:hypothetical protein